MRNDTVDVNSLVSFINDIKPYHSKLTEVAVEYQANDDIFVHIEDTDHRFDIHLNSVWEIHTASDGVRTQYRIPACVIPRHSEDIHQSRQIGVTNEINGVSGLYRIPFNNGLIVKVNGVRMIEGSDYDVDQIERNKVQFRPSSIPASGALIDFDIFVSDRLFIALDGIYQGYRIAPVIVPGGFDIPGYGYDVGFFDADNTVQVAPDYNLGDSDPLNDYMRQDLDGDGWPDAYGDGDVTNDYLPTELLILYDDQSSTVMEPMGTIKRVQDSLGKDYYIFEFFTPLALNTQVLFRVEQRETYNGWTQTKITDEIKFFEYIDFQEELAVQMIDPSSWDWWTTNSVLLEKIDFQSDYGLLPTDYITTLSNLKKLRTVGDLNTVASLGKTVQELIDFKIANPGLFDPTVNSNVTLLSKQDIKKFAKYVDQDSYSQYSVIIRTSGSTPTKAEIVAHNYTDVFYYNGFSVDSYDVSVNPAIVPAEVQKRLLSTSGIIGGGQLLAGAIFAKQTKLKHDDFKVNILTYIPGGFDLEYFDDQTLDSGNESLLGYYKLFNIKMDRFDSFNGSFTDGLRTREATYPQESVGTHLTEKFSIRLTTKEKDNINVAIEDHRDYPSQQLGFDSDLMDLFPFDIMGPTPGTTLYPPVLKIKKTPLPNITDESSSASIFEGFRFVVKDTSGNIVSLRYSTDATNHVTMTSPATTVYVQHNLGHNPTISVYDINNVPKIPQSVTYPDSREVKIVFDVPYQGIISLV